MAGKREVIQSILTKNLVFSQLDEKERAKFEPLFEVTKHEVGDILLEAGAPLDGLYYVYSGSVRIKRVNEYGKRVSAGVYNAGETFGEMALLSELTSPHQLEMAESGHVVKLPRATGKPIIAGDPHLESRIRQRVALLELRRRMQSILGTASFTPDTEAEILAAIGVKKIRPGRAIFKQGQDDPRLYLIESGTVEIIQETLDGTLPLERLGRDGLLGETAALKQEPHAYTAQAITETTVLVIGQEAVQTILELNYELKKRLETRIEELRLAEQAQAQGARRAEGVNQRINLDALTEAEFRDQAKQRDIQHFPLVTQEQESENAAACLTMVAQHYGKNFTLGQIQELANLTAASPDIHKVCTGAEKLGLRAKAYACDYDLLMTVPMPCLVWWEQYHYLALYKITEREVHVADPLTGIKCMSRKEFEKGWSNAVVALETTQDFERLEKPANPYMHFIAYMLPHKSLFLEAMLAALIINLLALATPIFVQNIIDQVIVHQNQSLLNVMLIGMALVTGFKLATSAAQSLLLAHTTMRIDMKMMSEFYRHILSLPMAFYRTRRIGEILARFGENQKIRAIIAGSTITVLLNTLMIVVYLLMMTLYSWHLTALVMCFIPMYIINTLFFTPRLKNLANKIFLTNSTQQSYVIESLNGIETIKASANEYYARARWENAFVDRVNLGYINNKMGMAFNTISELINLAATIGILYYGATLVMADSMSIGELMGFNMLVNSVMSPILQMVQLWDNAQEVRIAVERVNDVLNVKPEQPPAPSPDAMPVCLNDEVAGRIEFRDVAFRYGGEETPLVLNGFHLNIEPGQTIALVGPSGCGKSTVIRMLLGFIHPTAGDVLIDGKELRSLDLQSLRKRIGVVLQDSFLFSGTVAENIALGDPNPDMNQVREAARLSAAEDFIPRLAQGYNTLIGERGVQLSGGQRQRVCIARALYHRPKILIFDEATSALDNESEARIQQNMAKILMGKTSVVVAHRLTTVREADAICFIENGQVMEMGPHDELVAMRGRYYDIAKKQFDLE